MQPVQIENIENEGTIEITEAELELFKSVTISITEQNAAMQDNMQALAAAMIAQGENLVATFAALRDAIAGLNITINVPEQASAQPQITVQVPEQPAPVVNLKLPADKKKKITVDIKRDKNGAISGAAGTVE